MLVSHPTRQILLFGAGKSSIALIGYFIKNAAAQNWHITIADVNTSIIHQKTNHAACTTAVAIDVHNAQQRAALIGQASIVISLMPPSLHFLIAQDCVALHKNLLTASYIDDAIKTLGTEIKKKGLLFLYEMGLDPGIDHMSAMQLIHKIQAQGGHITSFKSHCGGLVAPESDNNPWHYKISWNPRNVVLAGNAGATYQLNNKVVQVPYTQVFANNPTILIPNLGVYSWYANRDSLGYIPLYGLQTASTFIRTTLRHPTFSMAWHQVVGLQMTNLNDADLISNFATIGQWTHYLMSVAAQKKPAGLQSILAADVQEQLTDMFRYLGVFSNHAIPTHCRCSADILQHLLETKLILQPTDKDLVVMVHQITYQLNNKENHISSSLVVRGVDSQYTAMAKTVGLPLGIATQLILNGGLVLRGLHLPILQQIYEPVLAGLEQEGIHFFEKLEDD